MVKNKDFLLKVIIDACMITRPRSFWELKRTLKKLGFDLDKAALIKRLKIIK